MHSMYRYIKVNGLVNVLIIKTGSPLHVVITVVLM